MLRKLPYLVGSRESLNGGKWGNGGSIVKLAFWEDHNCCRIEPGCPATKLEAGTAGGTLHQYPGQAMVVAWARTVT